MALALFDLDNTLLNGDSDDSWGELLIAQGLLDGATYRATAARLIREGDAIAYLDYCLGTILLIEPGQLSAMLQQFVSDYIKPLVTEKSLALIKAHKDQGDTLMIITATNEIITRPIARLLGVDNLIATQAELVDRRLTGKVTGVASYADGKVLRLKAWMSQHPWHSLEGSYFYSDSDSDIPLLKLVDNPVAVNANDQLKQYAQAKKWPSISLR